MTTRESTDAQLQGWFAGRLPNGWLTGPPEVTLDRDEILVVGTLAEPDMGSDGTPEKRGAALGSRIAGFRDRRELFTTLSVPAMTRLRMPERRVLDTLVDSGVARSRSHALAWCVRLVAERQDEWLKDLRHAMTAVEQVRAEGPKKD